MLELMDIYTTGMQLMIQRKRERYPAVQRYIVNFDLVGKPKNFHLNIMSVLTQEEIEE
jgi:hypothetical protein